MADDQYQTRGGILVHRDVQALPYPGGTDALARALDRRRGVLLSSSFEFPGRYTRWDIGFVDPPLVLEAKGRDFSIRGLNRRGEVLVQVVADHLRGLDALATLEVRPGWIEGAIRAPAGRFAEEARSRQPSLFSILRAITELFEAADDSHLGLYGAFGYDLVFQFEPMALRLPRAADQRDLVLFLPDELLIVDHMRQASTRCRYDFTAGTRSTTGLARTGGDDPYMTEIVGDAPAESDHAPGEYAAMVARAREAFARGDLFEVVLGQLLCAPCRDQPSEIFKRLRTTNPAPYGALMNLGDGEFLVAASPEMFVRVEGNRVETCPISGTIRRGSDAIEDAERIRELLNSAKDEAELTMCTDVDRNDKSRVCEAGSVRVIGRRQIEMYSRLIHTVDHVEGILRPEFDALDAFLSHAWAVTVTGAPKPWAIRFVEAEEKSARRWYGGAIGATMFNGNMNTGLTLRTVRMKNGIAEVRAGATLLHDSDPHEEEAETRLKASAMFAAINAGTKGSAPTLARTPAARDVRVLLIDHEDSFVHTLGNYIRATGVDVVTQRPEFARETLAGNQPVDIVLLSPGPGRPADFAMNETLTLATRRGLPVFGVCLGLQGMVEYCGGALDLLATPMHGKPSEVRVLGGRLFEGLPPRFAVGRYHSIHARRAAMPKEFVVSAETSDGVVMAIEHTRLPMAAVQFHPESVMTSPDIGHRLIENAVRLLTRVPAAAGSGDTRPIDMRDVRTQSS
ncbi:anthranilate synthase component I [Vineibacter terrae]|uniref:anthranilate synthase component I n=1 Tax=Vineibacter terrae TaxID=2586908 RepID=UPI002E32C93C|nr:anthranilate synthase component I [Vineibacter terrae]HEX2885523.1 anthranilate synthase component I [Vineibacter terrae]